MVDKPRIAVVFYPIGPYHHARLNAAADRLSVTGFEWSAKGYDAWGAAETPARYHKVSLFPEATDDFPGHAKLKRAFWTTLGEANPDVVAVNGWNNFGSLISANCCLRRGIPVVVMSESSRQDEHRPGGRKPSSGESPVCTLPHSSAASVTSSIWWNLECRANGSLRDTMWSITTICAATRKVEISGRRSDRNMRLPENYFLPQRVSSRRRIS